MFELEEKLVFVESDLQVDPPEWPLLLKVLQVEDNRSRRTTRSPVSRFFLLLLSQSLFSCPFSFGNFANLLGPMNFSSFFSSPVPCPLMMEEEERT
jgi:hypothetical protein